MTLGKEHFIPQSSIELIGRRPADCQVMHGVALSALFCMPRSSEAICKHLLGDQKSNWATGDGRIQFKKAVKFTPKGWELGYLSSRPA